MFFRRSIRPDQHSDEELVIRYKKSGNTELVGVLFDRYSHMVFLICMKYLKDSSQSEDVSMQVFEKLLRDLHKYDVRKFKPWLHTVTKNLCLVWIEKRNRRKEQSDDFVIVPPELMESGTEDDLLNGADIKEHQLQKMEKAMKKLNDEQRVCLEVFFLQQKSYQEVSEITGYTMKQVKSYIQNGKRNLKKHLEQELNHE